MKLSLRTYWRSSSTWRVRIALHWKGLDYEAVPVHLVRDGGEQHRAEHSALNPMEQIPVLLVDGQPLAQSVALVEFLEEVAPTPPLLPAAPLDRARVRQLVEVVNAGIQPLQNLSVLQALEGNYGVTKEGRSAWSRHWIHRGFVALEEHVGRWAGRYSFGDAVTLADLYLVPQLYNARRFAVDLAPFPTLLRVEEALSQLPAFVAAHPDNQPDAPKPD